MKMHIVVSWDISDGPNRTDINDQLVAVLKPYPWVRPLTTFYVVKATPAERDVIIALMSAVIAQHSGRVSLIVSPSMAGMYAGTLPQHDWDKINQITA
jgi:hypothetical protein